MKPPSILDLLNDMKIEIYKPPLAEGIALIEQFLCEDPQGFYFTKGGNSLHIHHFNAYLGSLFLERQRVEAVQITTSDWRTHDRRYFDLYDPNSLPDIAKYLKSWKTDGTS